MYALRLGGVLHGTVLREQRQGRHRLARQHAREVVEQGEGRAFDVGDDGRRQHLRLGTDALHQRFAGAQHQGRCRQADELESADALVDLNPGAPQHRRIDRVDVGAFVDRRLLGEAAQGLVGHIQRMAQLLVDPGHRAQVVA